jgi:hypothetical protein
MFPHVLKAVQQFDLVDDQVAPVVSSTNVAMLHNIFRALVPGTPRNRADWLVQVCNEVKALFTKDLEGCQKAKERKAYAAILAELSPSSCAWNACKVGCVLHGALGGATHIREGCTNPVQVWQGLAACKVRACQRRRANKQCRVFLVALERPAEGFEAFEGGQKAGLDRPAEGFEAFEGGQTVGLNALKNRCLGRVAARVALERLAARNCGRV